MGTTAIFSKGSGVSSSQQESMKHVPKLLVLSASLPGTGHGGGVIQDALLQDYPRDRYMCASLNPPPWQVRPEQNPASLTGVPLLAAPLTPEPRWRGTRFYLPVVRALSFFFVSPWRVRQLVAFGRRHGAELVWAEFQGETLLLAARVAAGLRVPLVGTIWDDPEGWLADGNYDPLSRRLLLVRFREAMRVARRVSVVSSAMQEAYHQEYGLQSLILRYGHDPEDCGPYPPRRYPREDITVGFAGSVYGEDAWRGFLEAVARLNAGGSWPPVKIKIFGSDAFPYRHEGVEVACQGWLPMQELLRRLAEVDFCYLPYWFMPSRRRHAEFSFPTKLTTYLAAGRPILYHGPEYAEASRIVRTWGLGLRVHSLAGEEIDAAVTRLARDRDLQEDCQQAAAKACRLEFNSTVMKRNFAGLIGIASDYWMENAPT